MRTTGRRIITTAVCVFVACLVIADMSDATGTAATELRAVAVTAGMVALWVGLPVWLVGYVQQRRHRNDETPPALTVK